MAGTRKILERVPGSSLHLETPREKSMALSAASPATLPKCHSWTEHTSSTSTASPSARIRQALQRCHQPRTPHHFRPQRSHRHPRHLPRNRRAPRKNLGTRLRRPCHHLHAPYRPAPRPRDEPHDPPPRPTQRLPAPARHRCPRHVRPLCRRKGLRHPTTSTFSANLNLPGSRGCGGNQPRRW